MLGPFVLFCFVLFVCSFSLVLAVSFWGRIAFTPSSVLILLVLFLFLFLSLIPSSCANYVFSLGAKCFSFLTHSGFPFYFCFVRFFFLFLVLGFTCGSFFGLALLVLSSAGLSCLVSFVCGSFLFWVVY